MVECTGLENQRTETYQGFESLLLRKIWEVSQVVRLHISFNGWKLMLATMSKPEICDQGFDSPTTQLLDRFNNRTTRRQISRLQVERWSLSGVNMPEWWNW